MSVPLINGKEFSYIDISVNCMGGSLAGVVTLNYEETQEVSDNHGTGNRPVSRGYGPIITTASIELLMTDVVRLRAASTDGSLLSLGMFDMVVVYNNGVSIVRDILKNCQFAKDAGGGAQGDAGLKYSFDLKPSNILFNQ